VNGAKRSVALHFYHHLHHSFFLDYLIINQSAVNQHLFVQIGTFHPNACLTPLFIELINEKGTNDR
jgi:hypothetical protein